MTRAMETADVIMKELGQLSGQETLPVPEDPDPILREGSPVRPEPDVGTWKPENDYFVDGCRVEAAFRWRMTLAWQFFFINLRNKISYNFFIMAENTSIVQRRTRMSRRMS